MTRKYVLKRRAERKADTRRRIVEATVELHSSEGPARTTISAIAERAGVERHTVYAHFPDERALFDACTAHWASLHPSPDPTPWLAIEDRERRLRGALHGVYGWYESVERDTVVSAHGGVCRALIAHLGLAGPDAASTGDIGQGCLYVFDGTSMARHE